MKTRIVASYLAAALLLAAGVRAQEKPKAAEELKSQTPLKVQVVLAEYEGEKKVSSLPYTLSVNAAEPPVRLFSKLRMGLKVPILAQGKENQFVYYDVGTNFDCSAQVLPQGLFRLFLTTERSSIYAPGGDRKPAEWPTGQQPLASQPILQQFSGITELLLRDGQTIQSTMATDPVSGRVLKVDVTLNVVK